MANIFVVFEFVST